MRSERPSHDIIEAWIAGTLPADTAMEVERFFEEHPEELPDSEPPALLREATREETDANVTALVEVLKKKSFATPEIDSWLGLLTPTDQPGLLGTLGPYHVIEVIATTGMATVLKAWDPELDRFLAIKILSPAIALNATARERFLREAKAMAALEHENILPIYEISSKDHPWFAMRYIEGGSLQDALDSQAPWLKTPEFLETLARQIGGALTVAHQASLIHRDIKPANILLNSKGDHLWLTDFGIARSTEDPGLTYGRAIAGTPRYMSPEQADGAQLEPASDLFSLGSVLYHCAAGRPPFEGSSSTSILHKVTTANARPVAKLNPDLPKWLAEFIDALLSKDPATRPDILPALAAKKTTISRRKWLFPLITMATIAAAFALFHQREEQAGLEKNSILIQETGARFTDLAEAIAAAPPKATLLLNGEFITTSPIMTPHMESLSLRAAPESTTRPRIIFRGSGEGTGLRVYGNAYAKGIDFSYQRPHNSLTSCFSSEGGQLLEVEDCRFSSTVVAATNRLYGVHGHATGKAIVRNCHFSGTMMRAILVGDGTRPELRRNVSLEVENCVMESRGGIYLWCSGTDSRYEIKASGIKAKVLVFFNYGTKRLLPRINFELSESDIEFSDSLIDLNSMVLKPDLNRLTWSGRKNHYRAGPYFLKTRAPKTRLRTLPEFTQAREQFSEHDSHVTR